MVHDCVLALGFFDGIHLGHAALLDRTRQRAQALGLTPAALSFDTHPDTLVFGTAEGNDTLCLDNFSIKKAERAAPAVYYVSTEKIDRGKRENLRLNTNLGDVETTLSLVFGDSIVKISPSFYKQNAGFFDIDYKLFHEYAYDGIYELYLETEGGDARVSFEVSGESGMPSTGKTEYDYFKSGDLEIDIDLKGGKSEAKRS